jgi:class 3 adenylate cyclase
MTISAHRKVVTVVFCDVVGSTALGESVDPEALQELLARYFERMKGIVEAHGGSVEKFIGDAVMAVFGVPVAHEDDALRACRAAVRCGKRFRSSAWRAGSASIRERCLRVPRNAWRRGTP